MSWSSWPQYLLIALVGIDCILNSYLAVNLRKTRNQLKRLDNIVADHLDLDPRYEKTDG